MREKWKMRILFRTGEKHSSIHSISSMVMDRSQPNLSRASHICAWEGTRLTSDGTKRCLLDVVRLYFLTDMYRHAGIPGKTSFTACISNRNVGRTWILIRDAKPQNACVACKHHFKEPQVWHFKVVVVVFFFNSTAERGGFSSLSLQI